MLWASTYVEQWDAFSTNVKVMTFMFAWVDTVSRILDVLLLFHKIVFLKFIFSTRTALQRAFPLEKGSMVQIQNG